MSLWLLTQRSGNSPDSDTGKAKALDEYLILFAVVLGVNLMPAFGPPTWSVLAMYSLNTTFRLPLLILMAAIAAALGRFLLAHAFRMLSSHVSAKTKRNVTAARAAFDRRKQREVARFV